MAARLSSGRSVSAVSVARLTSISSAACVLDAEKFGPALYKGGADPRMTHVGKFLREHHLDELPQLWNVFIGDMSFIGPRPERKFYIDRSWNAIPAIASCTRSVGCDLLRHAL